MGTEAVVLFALLFSTTASAAPQRWALAIGENRGVLGEEPLRFAEDDARRMLDTLTELGGVPAQNTLLVSGGDAASVKDALLQLESRMRAAPGPQERLTIYISSHAGDGALHLRNTSLPFSEVVDFLKRVEVRVGVLIVDACRSGSMTGTKGLRPAEERAWSSEVAPLEGRILISASGADEYAQESAALGGSYFTHHLITGLRGAADSSNDGRVTLDEAYRWAWARTVESTFSTTGGVQTPRFKMELRGQGELVLTELKDATSQLTLDLDAPGRWLLVDVVSGLVRAEVEKPRGPLTLATPPGTYRLRLRTDRGYLEQEVTLSRGERRILHERDFDSSAFVAVALKGRNTPLYVVSAAGSLTSPIVGGLGGLPGIDARVRLEREWFGPVNQLAFGVSARQGTSDALGFHQTELELHAGLAHHWDWSRATLSFGVDPGALLVMQSALPDGSDRTGLGPAAFLVGELRVHLIGPVDLLVGAQAGGAVVKKSQGVTAVSRASGNAGVAFSF